MKPRHILSFITLVLSQFAMAEGSWIASTDNTNAPSTWMCLQKEVTIDSVPGAATARIAADSKYWLWINGECVVTEGAVKRGPNPADTYFDRLDLAPYLKPGKNLVSALVWHFGKDGFSHNSSGQAGFFIDCDGVDGLSTDASWSGAVHPAYYIPAGVDPNFRLPESNIGFDARKDIGAWYATRKQWPGVEVLAAEGDAPFGRLHHRIIPLWKDFGPRNYSSLRVIEGDEADTLIAKLPYNAQVMPRMTVEAPAGRVIDIRTDNFMGGGEPGLRAEYITAEGLQEYENKGWLNGENVIYVYPKDVTIKEVSFRETGYDTDFAGSFGCSDDFYNRLWAKALRTLYVTMRDTYMDCPDRERAQWWGDEVNESGEAFYALSPSSHLLMKKGMYELMGWQRPDGSIFSPVPASNWDKELPGQMLASIGRYGFWNYYLNTGDLQPIADLYDGVKRYIALWTREPDGTIADRDGGWHWGDWGENIDKTALYNAWYYIAMDGQRLMASALGRNADADSIAAEMSTLKQAFNDVFWRDDAYRHPAYSGQTDDRVQALAVVAGIADPDKFDAIEQTLALNEHASPYMEKYVAEAYFKMGKGAAGLARLKRRFANMVGHPGYSTLFEGWGIGADGFGGGTTNHAWSGGGLTILSQYVCGVAPLTPGYESFTVAPQLCGLRFAETVVPTVKGLITVKAAQTDGEFTLDVTIPPGTRALIHLPDDVSAPDGKQEFTIATPGAHRITAKK